MQHTVVQLARVLLLVEHLVKGKAAVLDILSAVHTCDRLVHHRLVRLAASKDVDAVGFELFVVEGTLANAYCDVRIS